MMTNVLSELLFIYETLFAFIFLSRSSFLPLLQLRPWSILIKMELDQNL